MKTKTFLLALLALLLSLAACSPAGGDEGDAGLTVPPTETPTEQPTDVPIDLTEDMLKYMTFQGIYGEPVTLIDGLYEGEPFVEGGASKPTVTLMPFTALGDLNGDGIDDAAVLLVESSGGSGSFVYLAAVINNEGTPENVATTLLGDRVSPESLAIVAGEVMLEAATRAEDDPMCCPSLKTRTTYALHNGELAAVSSESLSEADVPPELEGTSWVLSEVPAGDAANGTEISREITAAFQDGQLTGYAGCNNYFTSYETDGTSLTLGLIGSTMMACDDARSQRETEFLTALENVTSYRVAEDILELYDAEGNVLVRFQAQGDMTVPAALLGTWYWLAYQDTVELNDITGPDPLKYTLEFMADGMVQIQADCNSAGSSVAIDGSSLTFSAGPMTLVECEPGSLYSEYLAKLGDVVTYVFDGSGNLVLNLKMDAGNMVFSSEPTPSYPSELAGQVWSWLAYEDSADGEESNDITVPDPTKYTLEFLTDGTYAVVADCNRSSGGYDADGSSLVLLAGPTTLAECEPGSLYEEFLARLGEVVTYVTENDRLYLNLKMDAGSMIFGRKGNGASQLDGTSWMLVGQGSADDLTAPLPDTEITIGFEAGKVTGSAGCNTYSADYVASAEGDLQVGLIISTRMACAEEIVQQEVDYLAVLATAESFMFDGEALKIHFGEGDLVFEAS